MLGGNVSIGGALRVDTINEKTSAAGVTVDSMKVKDGGVTLIVWNSIAAAGSNQATAAALVPGYNRVTDVDNTKAVRLPDAAAGVRVVVAIYSTTNSAPIYPASGDAISTGGSNNPITGDPARIYEFTALDAGTWVYTA